MTTPIASFKGIPASLPYFATESNRLVLKVAPVAFPACDNVICFSLIKGIANFLSKFLR
nr:MAG TPA: hypothetical protein [Bacteriophage sp.]